MFIVQIPNKICVLPNGETLSITLIGGMLNPTTEYASLYMQPLWHNHDLGTLITSSVSHVPSNTSSWVDRSNLMYVLPQDI